MQKAFIVWAHGRDSIERKFSEKGSSGSLEALNEAFREGWTLVSATPMGATGEGSSDDGYAMAFSLVIVEKK